MGNGGFFICVFGSSWVRPIHYPFPPFFRKPKKIRHSFGGMYGFCWRCLLFGLPGVCISRVELSYLTGCMIGPLCSISHVLCPLCGAQVPKMQSHQVIFPRVPFSPFAPSSPSSWQSACFTVGSSLALSGDTERLWIKRGKKGLTVG